MNCMNTGTGALTIVSVRLADAALLVTALLLVLLAAVAAFAVVQLFFDLARRFGDRFSRSRQISS